SIGKICPGSLAAKATIPGAPWAMYAVMNRLLPPAIRFSAPIAPPPPPVWVVVAMAMLSVSQESSPDSAKMLSPGSRVSSRTGITVPTIFSCIVLSRIWRSLRRPLFQSVERGGVATEHPAPGVGGLVLVEHRALDELGEREGERLAVARRGDEKRLRQGGRVGRVEQLRPGAEPERLTHRPRAVAPRLGEGEGEVHVDVGVERAEVGGLAVVR